MITVTLKVDNGKNNIEREFVFCDIDELNTASISSSAQGMAYDLENFKEPTF